MKLVVNQDCCSCSYCYRACPVGAPYYDGEQTRIDQEKCISCGKCVKKCPMGAIYDSENPPKPMEPHEPKKLEADAVIIGAGGSGMIAACRIAETGKKVVVLEKAKRTGCGAIHVAGPLQFFDTKWALDAGAEPVVEEKIAQTLEQNGDHLDHELVKKTLHAMPKFFDWLSTFAPVQEKFELTEARGGPGGPPPMPDGDEEMPLPGEMPAPGGEEPEFLQAGTGMPGSGMGGNTGLVVDTKSLCPPSPAFHNPGEFIMDHLFEYAENLGVTVLTETPAKKLIQNENGDIIGVHAQDPGGDVDISCKVCLVAAGSLLMSQALKKAQPDYADAYLPRFAHAINTYTGDGFELCKEAGVPVRYDDIWLNITGSLVMPCDALTVEYSEATGKTPLINTALRPHGNRPEGLMVNLNGERYENEQYANATVKFQKKQPKCVSYTIMPEAVIKAQPMKTKPLYDENGNRVRQMVPMMGKPQWNQADMDWWASRKGAHLVIADTIEEIAEKTGMPAGNLKATVAHYNELCAKKQDTDFGKDPDYLIPIENGPFYAIRTFLMSDGAEGGIPIDANCQVKGKTGVVKGLYASGDNSSGNIVNLGNDQKTWITNEYSWALCSSMIAADSMIRDLG